MRTVIKKLMSGLLAAVMLLSGTIPAYAEEQTGTGGTTAFCSELVQLSRGETCVNGKDTKLSDGSYRGYYKSAIFQFVGKMLGSKLYVAVLPEEVQGCDDFAKLFSDGKVSQSVTRSVKDIATARIDNSGKVTVTAKKRAGSVSV
ncbi:MAG: hypothetical protein NC084_01930 [Bacteroides sp.]|nr:hypothetical protein [Eubacterium sp.]MCM1417354.1 hypothetical protein [Roseburia sp.]MCM1461453.1 hypothetical protein [Bacteroides sp.]